MNRVREDIAFVLARRMDIGADFWATPQGSLVKGGPYSTLEAAYILRELGLDPADPALNGAAALLWNAQREDGRFQLVPRSSLYPCQTIFCGANALLARCAPKQAQGRANRRRTPASQAPRAVCLP